MDGLKASLKVMAYSACKVIFKLLYAPLKTLPVNERKVLFLSRQDDEISLDARLLIKELRNQNPHIEVAIICCRVKPSLKSKMVFGVCLVKSLYHLATAKVCILDSYWPTVSVLRHKSSLKVVQIWHALGKIKKSGKASLGLPGGRERRIANVMEMHQGYSFVIAGGKMWNDFYCESFGVSESVIRNVGLPRIDYLLNNKQRLKESVFRKYPELSKKPVVLYAPTFRRGGKDGFAALAGALDADEFNIVLKSHPNHEIPLAGKAMSCPSAATLELLAAAEYLITDYSAIALEAAAIGVKTYYYVYDYDWYCATSGLNIDLFSEMPGCVFRDGKSIAQALLSEYPQASFERYRSKWLFENIGHSTEAIADIVFGEAGLSRN
ncbi:MAG TPA: CDP-glycerol glycerophosphotransferase family protein [Candidatus Rubneribacter avistercoris]|nr:CDP-glycerol glycerophosphotransferase family protein [Candidatus Rubneribacter avistercoris]